MDDKTIDEEEITKISLNLPKSIVNIVDKYARNEKPRLNRTQMIIKTIIFYQMNYVKVRKNMSLEIKRNEFKKLNLVKKEKNAIKSTGNEPIYKIMFFGENEIITTLLNVDYEESSESEIKNTIGIDFYSIYRKLSGNIYNLQIWVPNLDEQFESILSVITRGSSGGIIAIDLTSQEKFDIIKQWIETIRSHKNTRNIPILLVGYTNHGKNFRVVNIKQINEFTKDNNLFYMEQFQPINKDGVDCFHIILNIIKGSDVYFDKAIVFKPGEVQERLYTLSDINREQIKETILDLASKYSRLQIVEIAEECNSNANNIEPIIEEMIENNDIQAKFFKSTQSIVFRQDIK